MKMKGGAGRGRKGEIEGIREDRTGGREKQKREGERGGDGILLYNFY